MDRNTYRVVNTAYLLAQAFPDSQSSDNVTVSIRDLDDNALDVNNAAMTSEGGAVWTYSWTPTELHTYDIRYYNATQGIEHHEYVLVVGQITGVPSGGGGGSTLVTLRRDFLIQIDNYNANDLTGDGSSGDLANKCINKALQKIYSIIKDSKIMEAYPSTSLSSTASQDYIDLSGISTLDEILSITDASNVYKLTFIPFYKYREWAPDPSIVTGVPTHYTRLYNRIYLYPRPTAVINYTIDFVKLYAELSADSDQALLPSKYNYWIYAEAEVEWYKMQDPYNIPGIVLDERKRCEKIATEDIYSSFNENIVSETIWGREENRRRSLYTLD